MSTAHALYIPIVALFGLVAGYVLGQRAALAEMTRRQNKNKE